MSEAELDKLVGMRPSRERVRLVPGVLIPGTRYRIDGWLGDGGTGVVYEATHEDLGRKVAIKVLHIQHSEDPEMLATFREEARAATKIGSPYIVEVIDFSELPDGRLLYVMERLRGTSLDREVEEAPLDLGRVVGILRQVCQGLAAAHDAKLVHRDIKPEHILLLDPREPQAQRRTDRIKIMDFGIAAVRGHTVDVQGTPSYMAPEQVLGVGVDPRNDIYSLGCTAYEMLAGHPPFRGDTLKEVLRRHMREAPVPPSELLGPGIVPPALEAVVLRCLAKKRVERYADMRELEAALIEAQIEAGITTAWDDLPVPDLVDTVRKAVLEEGLAELRATRAPVRRIWLVPTLVGATLATILGLGLGYYMWKPDPNVIALAITRTDQIASEAKDAAAKANFYYPPADLPEAPTAYLKVVELEQLTGEERLLGRDRALALRLEFADTLQRLGDKYWSLEHGRAFAVEYYAQSALFDDSHTRARERSGLSSAGMTELHRKAADGDFSPAELEAATPLKIFGQDDPTEQEKEARKWARKRSRDSGFMQDARVESLLKEIQVEVPVLTPPPVPPPPVVAVVEPLDEVGVPGRREPEVHRDPKRANETADRGYQALRVGDFDRASTLFHSALEADPNCGKALIGLSELHFDRAQYHDAVKYGKLAIDVDPRRASYRSKYGDALYKVHEYELARAQYERADELGSTTAAASLRRLDKRTGR